MKKLFSPFIVCLILAIMAAQLVFITISDGATTDEQIHILSGYTTLTQSHALFDPEHPFLAKIIAALPLLLIQPAVPYDASHLKPYQNVTNYNTYAPANHWAFQMLYQMGNNFHRLLWSTRLMMGLVTIGFALFCFWWAKKLWGTASAFAALVLVSLDPNILAHGHLVNDDVAASFCFLAALATFYAFLKKPSTKTVVVAGLTLGLGLITKYSLLLLGPTYVILVVLWLLYRRGHHDQPASWFRLTFKYTWLSYALGVLTIFIFSWAVIWLAYGILKLINPAQNPQYINYYAIPGWESFLVVHTLPVMWAKGAALLFDPNLDHFRDGYVLGQCYLGGRWYYFPVLLATKTPLPILALVLTTIGLWWHRRKSLDFTPVVLLVAFVIYMAFSMRSSINIGVRHILPPYSLLLLMAAFPFSLVDWPQSKQQATNYWRTLTSKPATFSLKPFALSQFLPAALLILLAAIPIINLLTFPNFLPYYNILAGEPRPIPYIASDSNVDWGQGTPALGAYIKQHNLPTVAFDNFTGDAEAEQLHLPVTLADPETHSYKGYLALSRSTIIDHLCTKNNNWGWVIDHYQPIAIIGNAVNLYYIN